MATCSSIASTSRLIAIGSSCGRVTIYVARTMKIIKVAFLAKDHHQQQRNIIHGINNDESATVVSLLFLCDDSQGTELVAVLGDGCVCVIQVPDERKPIIDESAGLNSNFDTTLKRMNSSSLCKRDSIDVTTNYSVPAFTVPCYGIENCFAVAKGDLLDIFLTESKLQHDNIDFLRQSSGVRINRVMRIRLIDGHCNDVKKGNPRSPSTIHAYDIHLQKSGNKIFISAISASIKNSLQPKADTSLFFSVGSVDMSYSWNQSSLNGKIQNVALTRRISLGLDYHKLVHKDSDSRTAQRQHFKYFCNHVAVVFTVSGIILIDVLKVAHICNLMDASLEKPQEIRIQDVTIAALDFSSLIGTNDVSGIPGDGRRILEEYALVGVENAESRNAIYICRTYPTPIFLSVVE
jgi:hypothetical protein